jgi:hypothetical protein
MTQDDEVVLSLPGAELEPLRSGLEKAGKAIGARYPVTYYQNFEPVFPKQHREIGEEFGLFR